MAIKIVNLLYKIAAVVCLKLAFVAQCTNSITEFKFKLLIIFFLVFIFVSVFCFWRFREQIWQQIKIYLMFNTRMARRAVAAVFKTGFILPFLLTLFFAAIGLRYFNTIYTTVPSVFIFSFFMACLRESVFRGYVGEKILKKPTVVYALAFVTNGSKAYDLPFVFMGSIHGVFIISLYMQGMYIVSGGLSCLTLGIFAMYSPLLNSSSWRYCVQSLFNPTDVYSLKRPASLQELVLPQEVTWKSYCKYFLALAASMVVTWLILKSLQPPGGGVGGVGGVGGPTAPLPLVRSVAVSPLSEDPMAQPDSVVMEALNSLNRLEAARVLSDAGVLGHAATSAAIEEAILETAQIYNVSRNEAADIYDEMVWDRLDELENARIAQEEKEAASNSIS